MFVVRVDVYLSETEVEEFLRRNMPDDSNTFAAGMLVQHALDHNDLDESVIVSVERR